MQDADIDDLRRWVGKTREVRDTITPRLAASLNAVLDIDDMPAIGQAAPLGIHWCLSPDIEPMRRLGPDGHPARGGFLPPVPFPRRMWAGGSLHLSNSFHVGDEVVRVSTIEDVTLKQGQQGPLIFVTLRHRYAANGQEVLSERQDIVYRQLESSAPRPRSRKAPPETLKADHQRVVAADPVLLFRYSAITFNGHRIHYDQPYATQEEKYPALIFHGPLQANLLLKFADDLRADDRSIRQFDFRSVRPLFAGEPVTLNMAGSNSHFDLWITDHAGEVTMKATATL